MNIQRFSIKNLTLVNLAVMGGLAIVLSVVAGQVFRDAAKAEEQRVLGRTMDVAAHQVLRNLHKLAGELGATAQQDRNLRMVAGGRPGADRDTAVSHLDEQFHQRYVTAGILRLKKLRLYDKDLNPVITSSEGVELPDGLPDFLRERAVGRSGAERYKIIGGMWASPAGPAYSVLVPVGGLRLGGYLEVVTDPAYKIQELAEVLGVPLRIQSPDGREEFFHSEAWPEQLSDTQLLVHHTLVGDDGRPVVALEVVEDAQEMHAAFDRAQWLNVGGFVMIVVVGIAFSLFMFGRFLFRPMDQLVEVMSRVSEGDLRAVEPVEGLREISVLGRGLAGMVAGLHDQVTRIQGHAAELSTAAEELSHITAQTREGVVRQRAETDQVATAMNEMSATVQEVAQHASGAAEAAQDADGKAREGREVVERTVDRIESLAGEIERAAEVIHQLESESGNISQVMDVIRGIAEQTNLLALNAAIEAARAGEQGRGFAVVADEVRTLASRTQESTQEIQEMIDRLQSGAESAVKVMVEAREQTRETVAQAGAAGDALSSIATATGTILEMNTQIATAAEEQAQVAEEINGSLVRITEVADQAAEGTEQTAGASESLARLAASLQEVVGRFRL